MVQIGRMREEEGPMSWKVLAAGMSRGARVLSRRTSLLALGSAAVTAVTPTRTSAKKHHGGKTSKQCQQQASDCITFITDLCNQQTTPQECKTLFLPCCPPFGTCNVSKALTCIFKAVQQ
jgi:hypothetical protein